jgi:dUTP pyrophosphatase
MEKTKIETYIQNLIEPDKAIESPDNSDTDLSDKFIDKLNDVLLSLNKDIEIDLKKKVDLQPLLDVNYMKLRPDAVEPTYAKEGDAGLDITATHIISNTTFLVEYGTGLAFEVPIGYVMLIFPRSSIRNYELTFAGTEWGYPLSNSVGVLDSGYRGELKLTFNKTNGLDSLKYKVGDRIGQVLILPYPKIKLNEKQELSKTERNTQGYGSSGE